MSRGWATGSALWVVLVANVAWADDDTAEKERQLDLLRAEIANDIQLQAAELIDELVYGWTKEPPFGVDTPVIVAGVTVPVSLGTGLEAFLENHLASLVTKHPQTHVQLVHCPACSEWVVHAGARGTVVSRGFNNPEALERLGSESGGKLALFVDFEAEGNSLVLRARITTIDKTLRILFARTVSTATSKPALLRSGERLVSAEDARKQYLDVLAGRGLFLVPLRLGIRTYARGTNTSTGTAPFPWVTAGVEAAFSQARAWTGSVNVGFSWLPQSHVAMLAQGRIARLLSGNTVSLTWPDVYGFLGAGVLYGQGPAMTTFRDDPVTIDDIRRATSNEEPRRTLGLITLGLEVRVKNRISIIGFLESLPGLNTNQSIGDFINLFGLNVFRFQSLGVEVSFCF